MLITGPSLVFALHFSTEERGLNMTGRKQTVIVELLVQWSRPLYRLDEPIHQGVNR